MTQKFAALLFAFTIARAADLAPIPIWPNGAPGSEGKTADETVRVNAPTGDHVVATVHRPSVTPILPAKNIATGAAVVILPGGGHVELWVDHEGYNVGHWLADHGIAGFVVKYRLARQKDSTYTVEGHALPDVQRAIRLVRSRAAEFGVDPNRIGIMGFSAGGELAAMAQTRFDAGDPSSADPVARQSSRPSFAALIYPAIPRDMPLSKDTPPAFLLCGENDRPNISQGLPELYVAMKKAGISAELHVLAGVPHGFGLRASNTGAVAGWLDRFREWMDAKGLLKKPGAAD